MVEAFAVASGKGGTGKTTSTLALGMALAEEYDVTVVDADTGMANLLFHAGLADAETTLHDLLVEDAAVPVEDAVYERFGMSVVPCGTSLAAFERADPERLRDVVADLAAAAGVLFNKVHESEDVDAIAEKCERYFDGPTLGTVPDDDAARTARQAGEPLLAHAPESPAADAYRDVAAALEVRDGASDDVAERFRSAVIPDSP